MDVMYTNLPPIQTADNPSHRLADANNDDKSLDDLAPIFPPPNFEVPDIRFSNSVSPNADFNRSLLSSAQMYNSTIMFMSSGAQPRHPIGDSSCGATHQHKKHSPVDTSALEMSGMNQQQMACFPQVSSSPLGTSSSDDNDDAPSSQLTNQSEPSNLGPNKATNNSSSQEADQASSASSGSAAGSVAKKSKACKRKKRKDPNEPQKPVSAYALFFRDSQAAIKGHNPSASFGEVSKIVASMWDQLNPEHKEVYKKKTELAKKQYLKQLAAYRANQVSQLASEDAKKSPLSPGNRSRPGSADDMTAATNFQNPDSHLPASLAGHLLAQQSTLPSTHLVQMSPHLLQQQQQQQRQLHHQQQLQQRHQISMGQASSSSLPPLQLCSSQHSPLPGPAYTYPPHVDQGGLASYQTSLTGHGGFDLSQAGENTYPQYPDNGFSQHTRGHPGWETEYYNSESVIPQCRDVFTNWVGPGPSASPFPVK